MRPYLFLAPAAPASLLQEAGDPRRAAYLARFADREGQVFMRRFLVKYQGKTAEEAQDLLLGNVRPTTSRLAAIHRTIAPDAPMDRFTAFVKDNQPDGINPD